MIKHTVPIAGNARGHLVFTGEIRSFSERRRGEESSKTASSRRDRHDNECAGPLPVVSIVLLRANEIHSAQNSLPGMKQHLRSLPPR